MKNESYLTIASASEGLLKEKGSRFLAFAFPVNDETEIKEKLESLRKKYHDARHHCYAWRLGAGMERFKTFDDGEPANSAGKPILGQIKSFNLTNILIVVVRYFGGTLLGVGGLIQAYKNASYDALFNAEIIEKNLFNTYQLKFLYSEMNRIMKIIKDMKLEYYNANFQENCELTIRVPLNLSDRLINSLMMEQDIKIELVKE